MKVSVIIPTHNYAHFLPYTLTSVLKQTYGDWECLIIDNASADNTRAIVHDFEKKDVRFKYVFTEVKGLSNARNIGLKMAQGEYIQLLDADDLIDDRKLIEHVNFLNLHLNFDLIYSDARYFNDGKPSERKFSMHVKDVDWMPRISGNGNTLLNVLIKRNIFPVSAPLFRRKIVDCGILFNEQLSMLEDWDFWFRMAYKNFYFKYLNIEHAQTLIRIHSKSVSTNKLQMKICLLQLYSTYLFKYKLALKLRFYLLIRITEEFFDSLIQLSTKPIISNLSQNLTKTELLLLTLTFILLIPVYLILKLYRFLLQ